MIKTSTKLNHVKEQSPEGKNPVSREELFYNNIKQELNGLVKDPANETIENILAYSRKK